MMFYLKQKIGTFSALFYQLTLKKLSPGHLYLILKYYIFGPSIVRWISLFQKGAESCIIQNGFISDFFFLFKAGL